MRFTKDITVTAEDPTFLVECIGAHTDLSKSRVKDAMNKGAVWIIRGGSHARVRRPQYKVDEGDHIRVCYDEELIALEASAVRCVQDFKAYSVWFKPAGMSTKGTEYGDHTSLLRLVEKFLKGKQGAFLVHELSTDSAGFMLVAHNKKAALMLSALFENNNIQKKYRIEVLGDLTQKGETGEIDLSAESDDQVEGIQYSCAGYIEGKDITLVDVAINSENKHQLHRCFEELGYPVVNDSPYGKSKSNKVGLRITEMEFSFVCPIFRCQRHFSV